MIGGMSTLIPNPYRRAKPESEIVPLTVLMEKVTL